MSPFSDNPLAWDSFANPLVRLWCVGPVGVLQWRFSEFILDGVLWSYLVTYLTKKTITTTTIAITIKLFILLLFTVWVCKNVLILIYWNWRKELIFYNLIICSTIKFQLHLKITLHNLLSIFFLDLSKTASIVQFGIYI